MKVIIQANVHLLNTHCKLVMDVRRVFNTQYNSSTSYMVFHMNDVLYLSSRCEKQVIIQSLLSLWYAVFFLIPGTIVYNESVSTMQLCLNGMVLV